MKRKIERQDKLTACYKFDKESNMYDIVVNFPLGKLTGSDANYLLSHVFTQEFKLEMERRGYDISTFKFEISPKIPTNRPDKFETLNKKYNND
jgi:hypothetical protein